MKFENGNADRIASSKNRLDIETKILSGMPSEEISKYAFETYGETITVGDIEAYKKEYIRSGNFLVKKVVSGLKEVGKYEMPPMSELDRLSGFFSFQQANNDLEMIYSRIKELRVLAIQNPSDDSYDKRIAEYLKRIDAIKASILKNQFEELRKSVILNIAKKIIVAVFNIFLPYIDIKYHEKVRNQFMSVVQSIINPELAEEPKEVKEARNKHYGEPTQEETKN